MPFDVSSLSKSLQAARIGIPAKRYILLCGLMAAGASVLWTLIWILGITTGLVNIITGISKTLIFILFSILFPAGVFIFAYAYPSLAASGRKSKINLDLPYAVTYMQALSTTIPLLDIFRSVHESGDLYGEVSKECSVIIRDVDVFGADLITAIENTRNTTPSDKFKELLNDLLMVYRSGGDLRSFFSAKSDSYREIAKNELESSMQFLEIIAEVYVTVFVAGPIAIMIMLVAQSLAGTATIGNLMPVMYIGLPVGAVVIIMVLYLLLPQSTLTISKKEVRGSELPADIIRNPDKPL
ncbi:MAG: type II secretion system F family protein, partial [Methanocorpusculum sp.]|nr:type II secretion system F family protein [Methanocorpusculum sp.]